jgi:uncharacterized protein (DUF58 family)
VTAARATLVLAVALAVAAFVFDASSLYVPGIGLLVAYAAVRLWVRLATGQAWVAHEAARLTVVEGERYPLDVVVSSAGSLPLPGGAVAHPRVESPVPLRRRTPARVRLEIPALGRGWQRIEPATLTVTDPLRLASAEVRAAASNRVLVLPRVEPVVLPQDAHDGTDESIPVGAGAPRGGSAGKRAVAFEMDGLRAYRPGSPASRIHWPILARTGELVERRLVGGTNASPVVALDAERPADDLALDRAVRAAASLCVHLAPTAGCVLLLPGERVPHRVDPALQLWPRAHARLAVVEAGGRPPDHRIVARDATLFWVSASAETGGPAPRRSGGIHYLVTTSSLPARDPAFTVAGCRGYRIGATTHRVAAGRRAA